MTLKRLGVIPPDKVEIIVDHLETTKSHLKADVSNYAKGRKRYWIWHEWLLHRQDFVPGVRDEFLWDFCKTWMPDADLGLACYGNVGIKPHRDATYADYRTVGINLGEVKSWYYDCQYPQMRWTREKNPSNPINYRMPVGDVFEFNCKNPHGVNNPAEDRWAIFLWKVSSKTRSLFEDYKKEER